MQVNSILERFLIKGAGKHLYRFPTLTIKLG